VADEGNDIAWPSYGLTKNMIQFKAGDYSIIPDTFREISNQSILDNLGLQL
jgi:hypothetical protein